MKISCLQEQLKRGLATVSRVVSTKSPLPILSNVLLAADGDRLRLAATDLEIGITCWIDAQIEEDGAITLPARLFSDIVNNLPNDRLTLSLDARTQTVTLTSSRFTNNIKGIEADDFPQIPTVSEPQASLSIPAEVLRQTIEQVAIAASQDNSRPVLTGVLVRLKNESSEAATVTFAAADGYRLATRTVELSEESRANSSELQEVIVPARALNELARIIGDTEEPVVISVTPGGGQILFHTESTDLVSRLIEGQFPDFERIIPTSYVTRTVIETQEFLKAVRLASLFASVNQHYLKLTMEPGNEELEPGKLVLNANAAELGDNTGELDGIVHGDGGQIAMNVRYVTDALSSIKTTQVAFETQASQNPGVFRPIGEDNYIHIIMPMTMR